MGPDLGRPMNATAYLTDQGLRALVRDPKSVRTWPLQQMPGFGADTLPEADLDALVAYLRHVVQLTCATWYSIRTSFRASGDTSRRDLYQAPEILTHWHWPPVVMPGTGRHHAFC
jgi:hypothetical protein